MPLREPSEDTFRTLLIVHDDPQYLDQLVSIFKKIYTLAFCGNIVAATQLIRQGLRPHVIIAPFRPTASIGSSYISDIRLHCPSVVISLMIDAKEMAQMAGRPLPEGVFMLINLGWQTAEIMQAVRLSFQRCRMEAHTRELHDGIVESHGEAIKLREQNRGERLRLAQDSEETAQSHFQLATVMGRHWEEIAPPLYHTPHGLYTAFIAQEMAQELSLGPEEKAHLLIASLFHDIGKTRLPAELRRIDFTQQPDPLNERERRLYESHVTEGVHILVKTGLPSKVIDIVEQHHEKLDGSGFPAHRVGEAILIEAQILAVADLFHNRVYRIRTWPQPAKATEEIPFQSAEEHIKRVGEALEWLRRQHVYSPPVVQSLFTIVDKIHDHGYQVFAHTLIDSDWEGLFPDMISTHVHHQAGKRNLAASLF